VKGSGSVRRGISGFYNVRVFVDNDLRPENAVAMLTLGVESARPPKAYRLWDGSKTEERVPRICPLDS
jgi:hypothetical protein